MSYEYDIFISYSNHDMADYVRTILFPLIKQEIGGTLGERNLKIFIDKIGVNSGDDWENRIKNCLIKSRIMIAILSPEYFKSEWCKKEMSFMLEKEQDLKFRCQQNPSGLIFPLKIRNQEKRYPKYVLEKIQITDIKDHSYSGINNPSIDLQREIRHWSINVADILDLSFDYKKEWMESDWQTQAHNKYSSQLNPSIIEFPKPTLEQRS
ncbi:MAG: toll/interleukin-1 receptor domain-containing protein [Leptospiraceae bacterium]|nr:toll/interleukin-1 receptor domain-containing protein [Leptospiraceae bacterium]